MMKDDNRKLDEVLGDLIGDVRFSEGDEGEFASARSEILWSAVLEIESLEDSHNKPSVETVTSSNSQILNDLAAAVHHGSGSDGPLLIRRSWLEIKRLRERIEELRTTESDRVSVEIDLLIRLSEACEICSEWGRDLMVAHVNSHGRSTAKNQAIYEHYHEECVKLSRTICDLQAVFEEMNK